MFKKAKSYLSPLLNIINYQSEHKNYSDNKYGKYSRITNDKYREMLTSWQVPAIKKYCGDLTDTVFLDVGAGDIVLGEKLKEIGNPKIFYVQDLSKPSLESGITRLTKKGIDTNRFVTMASDDFNFDLITDQTVDNAFSNSLFSHLSLNNILLCLKKLCPKMKKGAKYFSSMIVCPNKDDVKPYDWSFLNSGVLKKITSYSSKDPFHYSKETIFKLSSFSTGFNVIEIHEDYGHPFQKLVEFQKI